MNVLLIIAVVLGVILLVTGIGLWDTLQFLVWIGLVLLVLAIIVWLVRVIAGRRV